MTPYDYCPDDTCCVRCGAKLPEAVVPGTVQDEGYCSERCKNPEGWINTLRELFAEIVGYTPNFSVRISSMLFKHTKCGISFLAETDGVVVAGYAEGSDAECPKHKLKYPFHKEDFWAAVETADTEGCEAWGEANQETSPDA